MFSALLSGNWCSRSKRIGQLIQFLFVLTSISAVQAQSPTLSSIKPGTGIEGVITVGPIHGGPSRPGEPDSKPLENTSFDVANESGVITTFTTDDQGRFRISLAPGHYKVSRTEKQPKIGRYGPFEVDVVDGQMTKVAWHCDSGKR